MKQTDILIVIAVATVVAIAIRVVRRKIADRNLPPIHIHDNLMKRAEIHSVDSPFLKKICREYKANGHISNRQAASVEKAVARIEERAAQRK